jgi:N utilization substance protein A
VGVRGNRIKNIVDELGGERIDIVRWSDDLQQLIPNALQPSEVDEVILCQMIGKAIVLVREDQLSLAIGRRGQNVRLASKLCGWDIEIMTREELDSEIERAVAGYSELDGVDPSLAERLVGEGFLTYDELSVIEPDAMMSMGNLTEEQVQHIVDQAEKRAEAAEAAAAVERRRQREQERIDAATAEADQKEAELLRASGGIPLGAQEPAAASLPGAAPEVATVGNGTAGVESSGEKASTGGDSASGGSN